MKVYREKSFFLFFFLFFLCFMLNWIVADSLEEEAVKILQQYLAIDTTNPPGNEMKAAQFLKKILDQEGIENTLWDLGNNRANLLAVLRGDKSKKGVILLHHMDVVPASAEHWTVPPFAGTIVEGSLYGRGTIDIKGKGIIDLMTLIWLKRNKVPLTRDIFFLAVADEEVDSIGSRWMIQNQAKLLQEAEFLLDEGACVVIDPTGKTLHYGVSLGEKSPLWLTLIFRGESGHGSVPQPDSAVHRALRAANRILEAPKEFVVLPAQKEKLRLLLEGKDLTQIPGYEGDWEKSLANKAFLEAISQDPLVNAMITNTISITCLRAGQTINTIPHEASFSMDCRLLPGVDKEQFLWYLKGLVKDPTMQIQIEEYIPCSASPQDTDFLRALSKCARKRDPEAKVVPSILLSSTDSSFYRSLGIHAYGFESYRLTEEEADLSHSDDERISVKNIGYGIELLREILVEMQ